MSIRPRIDAIDASVEDWSWPKKKRPRQHIIADLSINHVERYVLLCGYSVERVEHDYGIDLVIFTYDANDKEDVLAQIQGVIRHDV
jgi:hypothetical protein